MWKFIKYIGIGVIAIFIIDAFLGYTLTKMYKANYCVHAGGDLNAYLQSRPVDTLILGSSRVNTMIDPRIIGKSVVNVSKPSKHLYYNVAVAELMHQYKRMPKKMLVVNLEVEDAYTSMQSKLLEDVHYLKFYYHENEFIREVINRKHWLEPIKYLLNSYRFNGENFTIVTNPWQKICTSSSTGFYPLPVVKQDSTYFLQEMRKRGEGHSMVFNPEYEKMLIRLKRLCAKDGIQLVLIYGPNQKTILSLKLASEHTYKICKKLQIPFLDFNVLHPKDFSSINDWFDCLHLNQTAAKKYSLLVKKALITLKNPTAKDSRIIN